MADALRSEMVRVQKEIDRAFDATLPVPDDSRRPLVEAMRHATIGGGKRLRPLLLIETARILGVDRDCAIRAACALEAIHAYSLIHDDLPCMDDDAMRHGKPSVHKAFGEATAVLAGDALQTYAFALLADHQATGDSFVRIELVRCLARAAGHQGMAGGQMMDMAAEGATLGLPTITRMQQRKTGALLEAAVEMGAILGHLPDEGRLHLRGYAHDIGLAFQIADDLLDAQGDAQLAGKTLRKDDAAGKQTFLTLLGAERAREQAIMLADQAVGHLAHYGKEADMLRALARFIVEREY
ncbi:MAG: polyprenyl synthetase family protein [Caenibius sp.]